MLTRALTICLCCTACMLPDPLQPADAGAPFLWGTATASFQVEGHGTPSDWYDWEAQVGRIRNGDKSDDGPNHYELFDADFAAAERMGHNSHRLSLDWPRLQRAPGEDLNAEAVAHYHEVFASMKRHRLVPMVTLQHFTLPRWLHDVNDAPLYGTGGWSGLETDGPGQAAVVAALEDFARKCGREFGGEVDLWVTINEPMVTIAGGYVSGIFPPGTALAFWRAKAAITNMTYAHARARKALRETDTIDIDGDGKAVLASVAQHVRIMLPKHAGDEGDARAARLLDYQMNWLLLDNLAKGQLDANLDGALDDPGDRENAADLGPSLDWVGINYYSTTLVTNAPIGDATSGISLAGLPAENDDPLVPHNDLGWEIRPSGMTTALVAAWERYHLPIYVTENGIADDADTQRPRFIVEHLAALADAQRAGADVRGYMHWSLMDNFEWAEGYMPRFGLLRVDLSNALRTRIPTKGAEAYEDVIRAGGVTPAIRAKWAP